MSIFLWSAKLSSVIFFFFNAPPTTEIYTLSLHDALPISLEHRGRGRKEEAAGIAAHCVAVFPAAAALAERAEIDLDDAPMRVIDDEAVRHRDIGHIGRRIVGTVDEIGRAHV